MNRVITDYNIKNNIATGNLRSKIHEILAGTVPEICRAPGGNLHIKWQYGILAEMVRAEPENIRVCDLQNRRPKLLKSLYACSTAAEDVRVNDICFDKDVS